MKTFIGRNPWCLTAEGVSPAGKKATLCVDSLVWGIGCMWLTRGGLGLWCCECDAQCLRVCAPMIALLSRPLSLADCELTLNEMMKIFSFSFLLQDVIPGRQKKVKYFILCTKGLQGFKAFLLVFLLLLFVWHTCMCIGVCDGACVCIHARAYACEGQSWYQVLSSIFPCV